MLCRKYAMKFPVLVDFSEVESLMLYKLSKLLLKRDKLKPESWQRYIKVMVQNCIRDYLKQQDKNERIKTKISYRDTRYNTFKD